jgi:hypothetical protein
VHVQALWVTGRMQRARTLLSAHGSEIEACTHTPALPLLTSATRAPAHQAAAHTRARARTCVRGTHHAADQL